MDRMTSENLIVTISFGSEEADSLGEADGDGDAEDDSGAEGLAVSLAPEPFPLELPQAAATISIRATISGKPIFFMFI